MCFRAKANITQMILELQKPLMELLKIFSINRINIECLENASFILACAYTFIITTEISLFPFRLN